MDFMSFKNVINERNLNIFNLHKCNVNFEVIFMCLILCITATGKGKLSEKAYLRYGKSNVSNGEKTTTYKIMFRVEPGFGTPGALIITNQHEHEFFLKSASLRTPNNQTIEFDCGSWIYPFVKTGTGRVFFSNTVRCITYIMVLFEFSCVYFQM